MDYCYYQYKEYPIIADVEITEVSEDKDEINITVKVLKCNYPKFVGQEIPLMAAKGTYAYGGMWRIHDEGEYGEL